MIWSEVIKEYGVEMAKKMDKSSFLQGITVRILPNGETDIPRRDIELAYKDVTKQKIYECEWD